MDFHDQISSLCASFLELDMLRALGALFRIQISFLGCLVILLTFDEPWLYYWAQITSMLALHFYSTWTFILERSFRTNLLLKKYVPFSIFDLFFHFCYKTFLLWSCGRRDALLLRTTTLQGNFTLNERVRIYFLVSSLGWSLDRGFIRTNSSCVASLL